MVSPREFAVTTSRLVSPSGSAIASDRMVLSPVLC